MKNFTRLFAAIVILVPTALVAPAQSQSGPGQKAATKQESGDVVFIQQGTGEGIKVTTPAAPGANTFFYVSSEMSFDSKVVKGAPYSAQTVRTFTQTLSDGNRIFRQSTGAVYRDSEGRTRREETFGGIGPWSAQNDAPQTIFINDPVAGVNYVLNTQDHTAGKITFNGWVQQNGSDAKATVTAQLPPPPLPPPPGGAAVEGVRTRGFAYATGPGGQVFMNNNAKTESLGTQVIEGVDAQGTRTTVTIPAGKIGNDLPIQIVDERWYSPDLQVVVMSRHSDPQTGETVYKLTNINRGDQPASLFQVPSDYTVKSESAIGRKITVIRKSKSPDSSQQQQ